MRLTVSCGARLRAAHFDILPPHFLDSKNSWSLLKRPRRSLFSVVVRLFMMGCHGKRIHHWVREQVTAKVPTLGLCYGHQLLAALFGGKVGLGFDGEKKRGLRSFEISRNYLTITQL